MAYLEILTYGILEIIDSEGINPVSGIDVSEEVFEELTSGQSIESLKQTIGYPVRMRVGMVQPYRIFRKRKRR